MLCFFCRGAFDNLLRHFDSAVRLLTNSFKENGRIRFFHVYQRQFVRALCTKHHADDDRGVKLVVCEFPYEGSFEISGCFQAGSQGMSFDEFPIKEVIGELGGQLQLLVKDM